MDALGCWMAANRSSESCLTEERSLPLHSKGPKKKNTLLLSGETGYVPGKWCPASIDVLQLLRPKRSLAHVLQEIWLTVHSQQALFVRAKGSTQPRCPNTAEWIKSSGHSPPVKYLIDLKLNELHHWNKGWVKKKLVPIGYSLYKILKKQAKANHIWLIYIHAWDKKSKKIKTGEWKIQTSGS